MKLIDIEDHAPKRTTSDQRSGSRSRWALYGILCLAVFFTHSRLQASPVDSMTYSNVSGVQQANVPMQFGRVFLSGEILNFPQVLVNGSAIDTQANVESRWPDGSVKHAIVSFILGSVPAGASLTFTFQNQLGCNCGPGARLTQAAMLAPAFDFDAQVQVGTTTVSARAELTNWDGATTSSAGPVQYWADGSIATTVILADHSTAAAYDIPFNGFKSLRPIFICTFWPGINKVKVRFVLENSNTVALQDISYGVTLSLGNLSQTAVYSNTAVPQVAATRWTKVYWSGGAPDERYNLDHNLAYLSASAAIPNYDTAKVISATQLAKDYTQWQAAPKDIYQKGMWTQTMGNTGGRPDLGPFPDWVVRWLYTGDYRERQISLAGADLAAAWPVNLREGAAGKTFDKAHTVDALGRVLSISARPSVDFSQGYRQNGATAADKITPVGTATAFNGGVWKWDASHLPDAFFVPYMLTGDFFYLEQSWFWTAFSAAYPVASTSANYGRGASLESAAVYMGQQRAEAWGLRERAETAWISPDGTPEAKLISGWMDDLLAILDGVHNLTGSQYAGNANWNWGRNIRAASSFETDPARALPPLHQWLHGSTYFAAPNEAGYGVSTTQCQVALSGFETHYLAYALGRARELGFHTDGLLHSVIAPWYIAVVTDPTFNPYLIQCGRICTVASSTGQYYQSMGDLLNSYYPTQADAQAAGSVIWKGISTLPLSDPVNGYDFLGSVAVSFIADAPGGGAAWTWAQQNIESAPVLNDNPKLAILPRSVAN